MARFIEEAPKMRMSRGGCLVNGGYPVEALPYLHEELAASPNNACILNDMGSCYKWIGDYGKAEECLKTAIQADPNLYQPVHNLALCYDEMGRFKESLQTWAQVACRTPNPDTQFGLATALMREKKFDLAEQIWERSRLAKNSSCIIPNIPVWRGQSLAGKKIFVSREGGHGDIFWQLRYLKPLKEMGARVSFLVYQAQRELLTNHPWIDEIMSSEDTIDPQKFDYQVPLWSVMMELRKCQPDKQWIPYCPVQRYISVDSKFYSEYTYRVAGRSTTPKVGVAWETGEVTSVHRKMRCIQEEYFPILAKVPVNWVSLMPGRKPDWCVDVCPTGWKATAEFMAGLDLVVSVDSAPFHLAGAMGIPTWLALPLGSAWFFFDEVSRCTWYPSVRIFRNSEPVSFKPVVEEIAAALRQHQFWNAASYVYDTDCPAVPA